MMEFNSINDFKSNFAKIYHEKVAPQLKYIDFERQSVKKKAIIFTILVEVPAILAVVYGLFKHLEVLIVIGCFVLLLGLCIYSCMQKNFENKLKAQIMPLLMQAFGNMNWTDLQTINTEEIRQSRIFSSFDDRSSDDNFYGSYNGMPLEISETELFYYTRDSKGRKQRHTTFKGALVSIGVGKNFTGHTIIKQRGFLFNSKAYEEVKLEDTEFEKKYFVDSNDQIEARFLLTPAFMDRFKNITTAFGASNGGCSFKNGKVLIALSTNKDLFKLGSLTTPVTDTKPYMTFLKEIISIYEMIDHLKVTQKIGL